MRTDAFSESRAKPGRKSAPKVFHVEVRPMRGFVCFHVQEVGARAGIERVAGRRARGGWLTVQWLIDKTRAHLENDRLMADSPEVRSLLRRLGAPPIHVGGDHFRARLPRKLAERSDSRPPTSHAQPHCGTARREGHRP